MRLAALAESSGPGIAFVDLGGDKPLVKDLQNRLGEIGLLDPPADGALGQVSRWALEAFLRKAGLSGKEKLDATVAKALLAPSALELFPLAPKKDLAGRLIQAMQALGYWVSRHPGCYNIVYAEALNPDGTANGNEPNCFNDTRFLIRVNEKGTPAVEACWEATTEPGRFYTENPLSALGVARIQFGQYKSWVVGTHNQGKPGGHEALVQCADISVCRDLNKDYSRSGDKTYKGVFGVNQHWGFDNPLTSIGTASAGCLVGRTRKGHMEFMALVKSDPRYQSSQGYRFMTAVLDGRNLQA